MAKARKKKEPGGRLVLNINGHELTGEKWGVWVFRCDSWPDLATRHTGETDTAAVLAEFMRRALASAVAVTISEGDRSC